MARARQVRADEETSLSEISILPDGRICIFGASRQVLEALDELAASDPTARQRLAVLRDLLDEHPAGQHVTQEKDEQHE